MLTINGVNENLKSAIESLITEEKRLEREVATLQSRLETVRAAIAPLRQLVSTVSPVQKSPSEILSELTGRGSPYAAMTLPDAIKKLLMDDPNNQPRSAAFITQELLAKGFQTSSGDFHNVVSTTLRKLKGERFKQDDEGRWGVIRR